MLIGGGNSRGRTVKLGDSEQSDEELNRVRVKQIDREDAYNEDTHMLNEAAANDVIASLLTDCDEDANGCWYSFAMGPAGTEDGDGDF